MKVLESAANLGNLEHICEVPLRSPLLRGITNIGMQTTSVLTQLAWVAQDVRVMWACPSFFSSVCHLHDNIRRVGILREAWWVEIAHLRLFHHAYWQTLVHAAVVESKNGNIISTQLEGISLLKSHADTSQTSTEEPDADEAPAPLVPAALDHVYFALCEYSAEVVKCRGRHLFIGVTGRWCLHSV